EVEDFFEQVGRHARRIGAPFAAVLFTDLGAMEFEQVFGAADRIAEGAISVVKQCCIGETPLLLIRSRSREAIRMELAAELVELMFQHTKIKSQARLK